MLYCLIPWMGSQKLYLLHDFSPLESLISFRDLSYWFVLLQLKFEDDLRITKMYSGEGEEVALMEELYPRGNVEDWMLRIEEVMKESLRIIIKKSLASYVEVCVN